MTDKSAIGSSFGFHNNYDEYNRDKRDGLGIDVGSSLAYKPMFGHNFTPAEIKRINAEYDANHRFS